jgi:hypothetical protein
MVFPWGTPLEKISAGMIAEGKQIDHAIAAWYTKVFNFHYGCKQANHAI